MSTIKHIANRSDMDAARKVGGTFKVLCGRTLHPREVPGGRTCRRCEAISKIKPDTEFWVSKPVSFTYTLKTQ